MALKEEEKWDVANGKQIISQVLQTVRHLFMDYDVFGMTFCMSSSFLTHG